MTVDWDKLDRLMRAMERAAVELHAKKSDASETFDALRLEADRARFFASGADHMIDFASVELKLTSVQSAALKMSHLAACTRSEHRLLNRAAREFVRLSSDPKRGRPKGTKRDEEMDLLLALAAHTRKKEGLSETGAIRNAIDQYIARGGRIRGGSDRANRERIRTTLHEWQETFDAFVTQAECQN